MSDVFEVGQQVHIKDSAKFGLHKRALAFTKHKMLGRVERIETTAIGSIYYIVETPDKSEWEYFTPDELERIEDGQ